MGKAAKIKKGVLIWPQKKLADEGVFGENVVWQEHGEKQMEKQLENFVRWGFDYVKLDFT